MSIIIQLLICVCVFLFATVAAWYEGSAIIEDSLEWTYSTPFTNTFGIEIVSGKEIVLLDYFVYAAKFQPFFPILMLLSFIYIIGLVLFIVGRKNNDTSIKVSFAFGIVYLVASTLFINATTFGGKLFFYILLISSILTILVTLCISILNGHGQKVYFVKSSE
ncbi:hypothetical protein UACE39S_05300 [Ureibacillus acetophenoni]